MEKAVLECFAGKGTRKAAMDNHVPYTTLRRRLKGEEGKKGAPTVLPRHVEEQILEWIKGMHEKAMSTNRAAVNLKIKEILEFTKQDHPFRFGVPGEKWWRLFLNWWPELTERKGQPLDKGRAMALNAQAIWSFFVNLRKVVKEKNLTAKDIWNCDEASFVAAVTDGGYRVLCLKGAKRAYWRAADYRENITYMEALSAAGDRLAGYYIFKGQRYNGNYIAGCEEGAAMSMQENGWIDKDLAVGYLDHLARNIPGGVGKDKPKLLILDPHTTHVNQVFRDRCKCGPHLIHMMYNIS